MYPFGILRYDDKRVQLKFKFEFKLRRFFCEVDITDDCLSKRLNFAGGFGHQEPKL